MSQYIMFHKQYEKAQGQESVPLIGRICRVYLFIRNLCTSPPKMNRFMPLSQKGLLKALDETKFSKFQHGTCLGDSFLFCSLWSVFIMQPI